MTVTMRGLDEDESELVAAARDEDAGRGASMPARCRVLYQGRQCTGSTAVGHDHQDVDGPFPSGLTAADAVPLAQVAVPRAVRASQPGAVDAVPPRMPRVAPVKLYVRCEGPCAQFAPVPDESTPPAEWIAITARVAFTGAIVKAALVCPACCAEQFPMLVAK